MKHTKDDGFPEDDISGFGEWSKPIPDILVVAEVYFLTQEKTLFHGDGEVSDALDFLFALLFA